MSEPTATPVSIHILGKEFLIACLPEERAALAQSAELLNARLREIRKASNVVGLDRMMVMAALNMANDLGRLQAREQALETQVSTRVRQMCERVEKTVAQGRQLEL
ncbi:MAG: cell division protein ZapA [Nevskiaceae bacterium]|jgi:cell division protein ZapA|nr:cell division protein ZapA [Nevskiaceae bacterium]